MTERLKGEELPYEEEFPEVFDPEISAQIEAKIQKDLAKLAEKMKKGGSEK